MKKEWTRDMTLNQRELWIIFEALKAEAERARTGDGSFGELADDHRWDRHSELVKLWTEFESAWSERVMS